MDPLVRMFFNFCLARSFWWIHPTWFNCCHNTSCILWKSGNINKIVVKTFKRGKYHLNWYPVCEGSLLDQSLMMMTLVANNWDAPMYVEFSIPSCSFGYPFLCLPLCTLILSVSQRHACTQLFQISSEHHFTFECSCYVMWLAPFRFWFQSQKWKPFPSLNGMERHCLPQSPPPTKAIKPLKISQSLTEENALWSAPWNMSCLL